VQCVLLCFAPMNEFGYLRRRSVPLIDRLAAAVRARAGLGWTCRRSR
jgi:hypothetical protein